MATSLIVMNAALVAIAAYAIIRQKRAERRARWALGALMNIKNNMATAKGVLNQIVGRPAMVQNNANQKRNFYLN